MEHEVNTMTDHKNGISHKGNNDWYGDNPSSPHYKNSFMGTHKGYVVDDHDPNKQNRVWVYIPGISAISYDPALMMPSQGTAPDRQGADSTAIKQQNRHGWIPVQSGRSFGGTDTLSSGQVADGRNSHDGYAIGYGDVSPFRIGDVVHVGFTGGDPTKGVIMGSIPRLGAEATVPHGGTTPQVMLPYNTPITSKTSPDACLPHTEKHPTKDDPGGTKRAVSSSHANGIVKSGTAKDPHRGGNAAGHAQRESPSLVTGRKSPGWNYGREKNNRDATGNQWKNRGGNIKRHINNGHSMTFDDSPDGSGIVLRSGQNTAFIMKDGANNPFIHLQSAGGKSYISLDNQGNLEFYGKTNFSVHCEKDMNFTSDGDINFQANKELNLLANGINLTSNKDYNVAVNGDYKAIYAQAANTSVMGDEKIEIKGNYSLTMNAGAIESKGNYDISAKSRIAFKTDMMSIKGSTCAIDTTGNILLNCGSSVDVNAPALPDLAKFKKVSPKGNAPAAPEILKGTPAKKQSKMMGSRNPQHQPDPKSPNNSDTPGTNGSVAPQQNNNASSSDNGGTTPNDSTGNGGSTTNNQAAGISSVADAQKYTGSWHGESTECVALVKDLTDVGATPNWSAGNQVMGNTDIQPGTAIATFGSDGTYTNKYGQSHAAIYLGQDSNGIQVLDQFNASPAQIRTIPFAKAGAEGGSKFYVIQSDN